MARGQTAVRHRGNRTAAAASAQQADNGQQQQQQQQEELTTADKLSFYFAQYFGLVCCAAGIGLLAIGYDKGWMENSYLSMACLALCLVGLLFHEMRPFNAQSIYEEEHKAATAAAR